MQKKEFKKGVPVVKGRDRSLNFVVTVLGNQATK